MLTLNSITKRIESVFVRDKANALTVINPETASSGALTAVSQAVSVDTYDLPSVSIQVSGTFVGTVQVEGTINGVDYFNLLGQQVNSSVTTASTFTAPNILHVPTLGCVQVRARCSAYTSGTINVAMRGSYGLTMVVGNTSLTTGSQLVGDVGVQVRATSTGAALTWGVTAFSATTPTLIKASAARIYGYHLSNNGAAWAYVKFHNANVAPTVGTGVGYTVGIPPNSSVEFVITGGIYFNTGLGYSVTSQAGQADTTAPTTTVYGHVIYA